MQKPEFCWTIGGPWRPTTGCVMMQLSSQNKTHHGPNNIMHCLVKEKVGKREPACCGVVGMMDDLWTECMHACMQKDEDGAGRKKKEHIPALE